MADGFRPWRQAMAEALYGDAGFYVAPGTPARHFRTSAHASRLWAQAIHEFARRVDVELGEPDDFTVVDVGAGGGELLAGLALLARSRWSLIGVDIAARPHYLPDRVGWLNQAPDGIVGLLITVELLDVVPLDVVEETDDGPRLVETDGLGNERLGQEPTTEDRAWLDAWWGLGHIEGDRAEIGHTRDAIWSHLRQRVVDGYAVCIDYEALPERDIRGTLTGFRDGRQCRPVPDGSCDITAHVRFSSLRRAGDILMRQRVALETLGISATRPEYDGNPASYLAALSATGEAAELLDPGGLGDFCWLIQRITRIR